MKKISKIPNFKSIEEEARFWDTHNITDYWDEMEEVDLIFVKEPKKEDLITIRVQSQLKDRLEKVAKRQGLSLSSLARMWIIEKLTTR